MRLNSRLFSAVPDRIIGREARVLQCREDGIECARLALIIATAQLCNAVTECDVDGFQTLEVLCNQSYKFHCRSTPNKNASLVVRGVGSTSRRLAGRGVKSLQRSHVRTVNRAAIKTDVSSPICSRKKYFAVVLLNHSFDCAHIFRAFDLQLRALIANSLQFLDHFKDPHNFSSASRASFGRCLSRASAIAR